MQLTSKGGRVVDLNEEQSADYLQLASLRGESAAWSAAFSGLLPSQITPEMEAARQRTRIARVQRQKQRRRQKRLDFLKYMNVLQALHAMVPEIHRHAENRIFHRARSLLPGMHHRGDPRMPEPKAWPMLDESDQAAAEAVLFILLGKLNANDWQKLRPLVPSEGFQRLVEHANVEALAALL